MIQSRTQEKHIKAKVEKERKIYKGELFHKPKSLVNVARILNEKLNKEGYNLTLEYFKNLKSKELYIPYFRHLGGVSHHKNLGPSARPKSAYTYVIDFLKKRKFLFKENQKYETLILKTGRNRSKPAKRPRMSSTISYKIYCCLAIRIKDESR